MVTLTRFFACFYCLFFFILFTVIRLKVRLPVVDTLFMSTKKISNVKYEISPLTHSKLKEEIFHQITTKPKRIRPTTLVILLERSATQLDESGSKEIMASCLVNNCELTNHLHPGVVPDAVIFHDNPPILSRTSEQIWIFYSLESPLNTRSFYYLNDMVNWTATYRLDSDLPNPYGLYGQIPTDSSSQIDPDLVQLLAGKTRLIAWLVSNCYTMNHREAYVHELAKHVQVDVYGTCSGRPCPWQGLSRNCSSMLRNDYKFYLAFENSNCRHYITEKLFINALQNDVVPVVMGAPKEDYELLIPAGSFIHVDDFSGPKELAKFLQTVSANQTLYESYFYWKKRYKFVDTRFWCRLCAALNQPKSRIYKSMQRWWLNNKTCQPPKLTRNISQPVSVFR
ncbi:Glycoprotein 3-alpha-L-fucosyltransferase A [Trichinella murrelli]|uniref:Fucosyltransferase n=1 Tax=Trichinella murrelli TaxID=144512 RepID=A0A0V0UIK4_9BILA|nr:Glycoprotein 3-alpha-L-fucosyltransferase A [Trichinella murrelli]